MDPTNGAPWWVLTQLQDDSGDWDVTVQIRDGRRFRIHVIVGPGVDVPNTVAAGVEAWLKQDRRWTPKSERGGTA